MNKKIKIGILLLLFIFSASSLFAIEEYISEIYKDLDQVFIEKSEKELDSILQKNQGDRYYYLIEKYAEKKIRLLVIQNEYIFAMAAIEVVIDNNLDNENAVEMYAEIADSYENLIKNMKQQEEVKAAKAAKLEEEKQKVKGSVDKKYVSSTSTASGKGYYISGVENSQTNYQFSGNFGLLDFTNFLYPSTGKTGFNYGICLDTNYKHYSDSLIFGLDVGGDLSFLTLGNAATGIPMLAQFQLIPEFAFPEFSDNLFLRVGALGSFSVSLAEDTSQVTRFISPVIGAGLENVKLGKTKLNAGIDYYMGHLFYSDILVAFGGNASLFIPISKTEKFQMNLELGLKEKAFIRTSGVENRASIILAIGAENVR